IEGGFDVEQELYEEDVKVVILPDKQEVASEDLATMPDVVRERVSLSMTGIMAADSVSHTLQVQQWDGEVRQESKHAADLKQLDNGVKIPPSGWRCEVCDLQENIWMNLTDGKVLCGRRYFDGSGGNNHALLHFQETGYPLAVKLGTITPDGADVYSYDEDDMVLDSKLPEHLAHFGIDMMTMEKTERTMTELEIAVNQRVGEWEVIQESGTTLKPLFGTGLTGMKNLGNSCYLNSVMQVLFTIPDFQSTSVSSNHLHSGLLKVILSFRVAQTVNEFLSTDVSIDVPDTLDLSALRATGQQPGEELLPEVAPPPLMTPDVEVKGILGSHGIEDDDSLYSPLLCHGLFGVHVSVSRLSADFSAPLVLPGSSSGPGTTPTESLSEEHLATIVSMGFMDWIFSHLDDLESMDVSEGGRSAAESEGGRDPPPGPRVRDGPGSELMRE
ncbi:hypothetical protein GOODEAATRI_006605, partial [Goodea atripinnis]